MKPLTNMSPIANKSTIQRPWMKINSEVSWGKMKDSKKRQRHLRNNKIKVRLLIMKSVLSWKDTWETMIDTLMRIRGSGMTSILWDRKKIMHYLKLSDSKPYIKIESMNWMMNQISRLHILKIKYLNRKIRFVLMKKRPMKSWWCKKIYLKSGSRNINWLLIITRNILPSSKQKKCISMISKFAILICMCRITELRSLDAINKENNDKNIYKTLKETKKRVSSKSRDREGK